MTRYLILLGLRWLPVGFLIPVSVLLPLDRGLSLAQVGALAAVQGVTVMILELPTGGLSDAIGRRPVLVLAVLADLAALGVLLAAASVPMFLLYWLLKGIHRALDSGPLESWYVDRALARDPAADIETGLSRGSAVTGAAVAGGALLSGGLIALGPNALGPIAGVESLAVPVVAAIVLDVVSLTCVLTLMTEERPARGVRALMISIRGVPAAIGGAVRLARGSRVVLALIAAEFLWGLGMPAFESLTPVRLTELLGDAERAAALMGPVGSAAWGASALGAALIPLLSRRIGARWTGVALRLLHGATVAAMGLIGGAAGVIAALLFCYAAHGATDPVHSGLLHRQVDGAHRASLLSLNSMAGQPGGALGLIALTSVAAQWSVATAVIAGAVVLAAAAPLYLVKDRYQAVPRWSLRTSARRV